MAETMHANAHTSRTAPSLRQTLRLDAGARLGATYWGCLVVVDLTRGLPQAVGFAAVALLVAVCSIGLRRDVAVAAAGIGWLFVTGFLVNAYGELALHGAGDGVRLLLLVAVATASAALSHHLRGAR